jgi:hypothetical protein
LLLGGLLAAQLLQALDRADQRLDRSERPLVGRFQPRYLGIRRA